VTRRRLVRPPRVVVGAWGVGTLTGALLLVLPAGVAVPQAQAPADLAEGLARVMPPGAHDVRVDYVYDSGHDGVWQSGAHLTWRDASGALRGGFVVGLAPPATQPATATLRAEHANGVPLAALAQLAARVPAPPGALQLWDLEGPDSGPLTLVACAAPAPGPGGCVAATSPGRPLGRWADTLVDDPAQRELSVARADGPGAGAQPTLG